MNRREKLRLAARAKRAGARYCYRIVDEADKARIPIALGFALCEQETGFQNIFGHDPTIFAGAGEVTKKKYLRYKRQRGPTGRGGMQGVGVTQLTYYSFQDRADHLGGCWRIRPQLKVAFELVRSFIQAGGEHEIWRYNGAKEYGPEVLKKKKKWHRVLFP